MTTLYHGGAAGLDKKGKRVLRPPSMTGVEPLVQAHLDTTGIYRSDRVFVVNDLDAACLFAARIPGGGTVYEVVPVGDLEPDPDFLPLAGDDVRSFQVPMARVVRAVRRRVTTVYGMRVPEILAALEVLPATAIQVATVIRAHRFRYSSEDDLQRAIAELLAERFAGHPVEREVILEDDLGRIDVVVDRVGVEVKIAGQVRAVSEQMERYARSERLDELVLVTTRAAHGDGPGTIGGKPAVIVSLIGGQL